MKKMLMVLAVMAMVSPLLADDGMDYCIWWQVDENYHKSLVERNPAWGFDAARLVATLDDSSNVELGWQEPGTRVTSLTPGVPASLAELSRPIQSIFVEFYALNGEIETFLGNSDPTAWADVASAVDDFRGSGSSGGTLAHSTVYSPTGYNVPEPTSGLLFVFGLAGLALRRKSLVVSRWM